MNGTSQMKLSAAMSAAAMVIALPGCGAPPIRAEDPSRYVLVAQGHVPSAPELVDCLTDQFTRLNAGNTAFSVKQTRRVDSLRVEVYTSNVVLGVSSDVFDDGRAELRIGPDPLGMYTKEQAMFRGCVSRLGTLS